MSKSALLSGVTFTALSAIAILAFASVSRAEPAAREVQEEALFGSYWCSVGASDGYLYLSFNATGDIFDEETYVSRSVRVSTTPGETCEYHSGAVLASLSSGPCAVSQVEIRTDEYGETRSGGEAVGSRGALGRDWVRAGPGGGEIPNRAMFR